MLKLEVSPRGSAYITYRDGDKIVSPQVFVGGENSEVIVDVNASGDVVGIEIVDISIVESVDRARVFAEERGLPFPRKIDIPSAPA